MSTYWTTVARKKCPKRQKIYNTHDKGVQKWIIPSRQKRRIFPTLDLNIYICGNWHQTVVNPDFLPHICLTDLLGCPFSFRIQASQKYKRYRNKLKNTECTHLQVVAIFDKCEVLKLIFTVSLCHAVLVGQITALPGLPKVDSSWTLIPISS